MAENKYNKRIKLSPQILAKISKIDEFKGLWRGGIDLHPQILKRLKAWVIITSSGASTRIEGADLDDEEVARLLRGLKTKAPKNRDEEEVAGYADLLGRVFDNWQDLKMSENNILHFHKILLNFSKKDRSHLGRYKSADNTVVMRAKDGKEIILFKPTPPYLVKPQMQSIIDWTSEELSKKEIHSLLIVANFIFEFLAIHPFLDGNGRLSRALTNLLLLKAGYSYIPYVSLDEIIEDHKNDYYLALRQTQKNHNTKKEDITPWANFLLEMLLIQTQKAKEIMDKKQPEKLLSEKQELIFALFKDNQILAVAEIFKKLKNKVPKVTIKQALSRLVVLGLLERLGQGRGIRYQKKSS